jgi:hypothetical protein
MQGLAKVQEKTAMIVVPRQNTPLPMSALPGLIGEAFERIGRPLTPTQEVNLAVLAAIETGRGAKTQNFNIGNISAAPNYAFEVWRPPWFEPPFANASLERLHAKMKAGQAPSAFRAYTTAEEGAEDFARQLLKSYPNVLDAAKTVNANALRVELSKAYSKDYADPRHTATIARLQVEYGLDAPQVRIAVASGTAALVIAAAIALLW